MLTLQEIFNRAYIGMMKQGCVSSKEGSCRYETVDNGKILRCAWGHVLGEHAKNCPDGDIISAENPVSKVNVFSVNVLGDIEKGWAALGRHLQGIHDGSSPEFWEEKLKRLADTWGLSVPSLD